MTVASPSDETHSEKSPMNRWTRPWAMIEDASDDALETDADRDLELSSNWRVSA
jgi:hypothetical protein